MSSPGFTIGDYRSYRRWHYRSYRKGAIGLSGTIGVLSEFTIGLSDRGSSKVDRSRGDYPCAQEQGMGHASDEAWGGSEVVPARRVARTLLVAT